MNHLCVCSDHATRTLKKLLHNKNNTHYLLKQARYVNFDKKCLHESKTEIAE